MTKTMVEEIEQASRPRPQSRGEYLLTRLRHPKGPLTEHQSALWAGGVATYLVVAWLLVERGLVKWLSGNPSLSFYLVRPIIWLGLAAIAYLGWQRLPQRPPFSRVLTGIATLLGAFHVGLLVFAGLILGFGDSYVAGQLANYPRNLWFVATWLIGLETTRVFLFHAWRPFSERWAFAGTATILALAMTPYGHLSALTRSDTLVSTLGGFVIPTVVLSVLLTWLAEHGGLGPSFGYWSLLLGFEWFSQVQPNLEWPVLFLIGTAGPIISAKLIRNVYLDTEEGATRWAHLDHCEEEPEQRRSLAWTVGTGTALVVVLGLAGMVGLRPAVVNGISMEPAYERGDMAIIQQGVDPTTLATGDVVKFRSTTDRSVVHRIVAIEQTSKGLVFTTRGDNNPRPDEPFTADLIEGKVVFLIPAIGWPAIWVRGG